MDQNQLGEITPTTTAVAYGCSHMHELNDSLPCLTKPQAEATIDHYCLRSAEGKTYAMVFIPDKGMKKQKTWQEIAEQSSDVVSKVLQFLRKVTKCTLKKIQESVKLFFSPNGKFQRVAVTCKKVAKKLLENGFNMQQFPVAIS